MQNPLIERYWGGFVSPTRRHRLKSQEGENPIWHIYDSKHAVPPVLLCAAWSAGWSSSIVACSVVHFLARQMEITGVEKSCMAPMEIFEGIKDLWERDICNLLNTWNVLTKVPFALRTCRVVARLLFGFLRRELIFQKELRIVCSCDLYSDVLLCNFPFPTRQSENNIYQPISEQCEKQVIVCLAPELPLPEHLFQKR